MRRSQRLLVVLFGASLLVSPLAAAPAGGPAPQPRKSKPSVVSTLLQVLGLDRDRPVERVTTPKKRVVTTMDNDEDCPPSDPACPRGHTPIGG